MAWASSRQTPWPGALKAGEYGRDQHLREWLEQAVGLGLGAFDLIIIDEAHKSRGSVSGLSRLLDKVVVSSPQARRLAMTATPVELDVSQWVQILTRIGCAEDALPHIKQAIADYAAAVTRVRQCPSSVDARANYKKVAAVFQTALTPFLLRRDKREETAVQLFVKHSQLSPDAYRLEKEISVATISLPTSWKQAVCAAESLSVVTRRRDNTIAQRTRLTMGSGHGIAALLDQAQSAEEPDEAPDAAQEIDHSTSAGSAAEMGIAPSNIKSDTKRQERVQWWLQMVTSTFSDGDETLFEHPALLAAVQHIENTTCNNEKVLVFGRFTRPLRALTDLINAREMLRWLESQRPWPRSRVHGGQKDPAHKSEWPAVRAAHRQLNCRIPLSQIDQTLKMQYAALQRQREKWRSDLMATLEEGVRAATIDRRIVNIFQAFKKVTHTFTADDNDERHPLAMVAKAMHELLDDDAAPQPIDLAEAFAQLINALCDRDEGDANDDGDLDTNEALALWPILEERLHDEYNRPQGGFARLMYGATRPAARRILQLAFNRHNSFPKVLVAQSMVGREGLNLHRACRTVVLLHPEWNPGIVEQQIGRVDRVASHWEKQLQAAIASGAPPLELPRIEICPIVFKATYDEYNWKVLRERWDDLRAQLHGVIIPGRLLDAYQHNPEIISEIAASAPDFSPSSNRENGA